MKRRLFSLLLVLTMIFLCIPAGIFAENDSGVIEEEIIEEIIPAEEPVTEPAEEPVTEPVEEPASEPVEEPATEPVEEPASEPVEEPATEPVEEPATESVTEPVTEAVADSEVSVSEPEAAATESEISIEETEIKEPVAEDLVEEEPETEAPTETDEPVIFVIVGDELEAYNGEDEEVYVPDGIKSIGVRAFEGNEKIKKVFLPDSVEYIKAYAFAECSNLEKVVISEQSKLKTIFKFAFQNDKELDYSFAKKENLSLVETAFDGVPGAEELYVKAEAETPGEENVVEIEAAFAAGDPINITQQPEDVEIAAGEFFVATVAAEGSNLNYQWEFLLPGTTTWKTSTATAYLQAQLKFKATAAMDGRKFHCIVSDDQGHSVTSDDITLTINPIKITQQPEDAEVAAGEFFVANVMAEGSDNLSYQWEFLLPGTTTWKASTAAAYLLPQLKFKATAAMDGRKFHCVVSDNQGHSVTSDDITLTINPIKITQQPTDVEVAAGEFFVATVAAEGSENLTYQWEFLLPGTTTWKASTAAAYLLPQLKFKATAAMDGREFHCIVSDNQGHSITSNDITLTIKEELIPITITQQPTDVEVAAGEFFVATVAAEGSNLNYQWEFLLPGATTWKTSTATAYLQAQLKFKATSAMDGRKFHCVISDDQGQSVTTDDITLTIKEELIPITITQQPTDVEVAAGEFFVATVAAEGSNLNYQWEFLLPGATTWKTSTATAYLQAQLKFKATAAMDGRKFHCVISDDQGQSVTTDDITLTIKEELTPITITQQPTDVEVAAGEFFVATVVAEGSNLDYQWEFLLPGATTWKTSTATAYLQAQLKFKATAAMDGRKFHCVISDDQGQSVTTDDITLTIKEDLVPITITQQPEDAEVVPGEFFVATVVAEGSNLNYQWEFLLPGTTTWKTSTATAYLQAQLKFKATTAMDGRKFHCVISDDQGQSVTTDDITLTVNPIKITQQPVDAEVAAGEFFVASVTAEGSDNLTYQWEFLLPGTTTWRASTAAAYLLPELKFKATAAMDGRKFHCIVSDDQGHSVTSDEITLTINPIKITQQPTDVEVAVGEFFVATVVAEGSSSLTYQWEFMLPETTTWKASTAAAYLLPELKFKATATMDGRKYRCIVSDDQGHSVTSDEIILTIKNEQTDGRFNYKTTDDGNGIIITKYLLEEASVTVPAAFGGIPVVEIGPEAFMNKSSLISIDLPDSITIIGARAFKNCTSLSQMN